MTKPDAELVAAAGSIEMTDQERLRKLLALMYDRWENGTQCYEDPDEEIGYLGNAFKLSESEEDEILAALS